jgi:hypothetical protein
MRRVTLLILALLTVAGAIGTSIPAVEAAGGGGTPGCNWTCNCAGTPVCRCASGTTGFCSYPSIQCPQVYTC